jgi:hypothetical protein
MGMSVTNAVTGVASVGPGVIVGAAGLQYWANTFDALAMSSVAVFPHSALTLEEMVFATATALLFLVQAQDCSAVIPEGQSLAVRPSRA